MSVFLSPTRSIAGTSLGTLHVRLTVDPERLLQGMSQAQGAVTGATNAMTSQLRSFTVLSTAALAAVGAASAQQFAKFNQAMTESVAVMGDVSARMRKEMEQIALDMSTQSNKSSIELAKTYYELAQAGYTASQSMKALPAVIQFATAAVIDSTEATKLLSEAQTALGMKTDDAVKNMENMVKISDVLAKASFLTTGSIKDIGDALTNKAAGAMRDFGVSLEEGVAVLSTFIQRGYSGKNAGQALYVVLRDIQRAILDQPKAWEDLGIAVYNEEGRLRSMADIMEDLSTAMETATDQEKRWAYSKLGFTDRSLAATLALKGTADTIRDFQRRLTEAGGTTQQVSDTILSSFQNQLVVAWHNVQNLAIQIGEELAPTILELGGYLVDLTKWLSETERETGAIAATFRTVVDVLKAFVVGLAAVWTVLKSVATIIATSVTVELEVLKVAIPAILDLTKLWSQAITDGLIPAYVRLAKIVGETALLITDSLDRNFKGVSGHVKEIVNLSKAVAAASSIWEDSKKESGELIDTTSEKILAILQGFGKEGLDDVTAQWSKFVDTVLKFFPASEEGMKRQKTTFKEMVDTLVFAGDTGLKSLEKAGAAVETQVKKAVRSVKELAELTKSREILDLIGGAPVSGKTSPLSLKEMMGGIDLRAEDVLDSSRAKEMMRKAGMSMTSSVGPEGMMLDSALGEAGGIGWEIKAEQNKLKILEELGKSEIQLTEDIERRREELVEQHTERLKKLYEAQAITLVRSGQNMFDSLAEAAETFGGRQSGVYKAMFAASKAFAIAESIIKIQQGIANAASLPFPANLAAMASVVAATANIVSTIGAVKLELSGKRAAGGLVSSGGSYLVGERGPEIFSPSSAGTIIPNNRMGGGMKVIVNNFAGVKVEAAESQENGERVLSIAIRRAKAEIASDLREGKGDVTRALSSSYQLKRRAL